MDMYICTCVHFYKRLLYKDLVNSTHPVDMDFDSVVQLVQQRYKM